MYLYINKIWIQKNGNKENLKEKEVRKFLNKKTS